MKQSVQLGDRVRDRISGFEGIVTGKHEYLYGCRRVTVSPTELKEGKRIESDWLDEDQVDLVESAVIPAPSSAPERGGGPADLRAPEVRAATLEHHRMRERP
jgi:hypothetical protein